MNIPVIFQFLKEPSVNNNREWFNARRERYENARDEFEDLLTVIISRISLFDESIHGIEAKGCTYRIYRNTRFPEDKAPYKNHFGDYINAKGRRSDRYGYYIHLQPGNCLLADGNYCPPSPLLKASRQAVHNSIDELQGIVGDPVFKQYFPAVGEDFLKTVPRGFPRDYPHLEYLQCKEYTVVCNQPDSFFLAPGFLDHTGDIFEQMKRFSDFVNYAIDNFK